MGALAYNSDTKLPSLKPCSMIAVAKENVGLWISGWYAAFPRSDLQERLKCDLRISVTEYRIDADPGCREH